MKGETKKLSWFQKLILLYLTFVGFLSTLSSEVPPIASDFGIGNIFEGIGRAFAIALIVYFIMWLFNKYIVTRINVKNELLKRIWLIIKIIVVILIGIWSILILYSIWISR